VPAAQIFISIARAVKATEIIVPTIGLADGIIKELCTKIQTRDGVGK
jgi:exopolyphosphatase/guanosine-5'-triphosphate,3'-diphosphate pyrophosphatase